MIPRDRYRFLHHCIGIAHFEGRDPCVFVSLLLPDKETDEFLSGATISVEFSQKSHNFIQEWVTTDLEAAPLVLSDQDHRKRFLDGDEKAIFEFVRYRTNAFRYWWVVDAIERWQVENSKASVRKLQRLFKEFTEIRGQNLRKTATDLLRRDQRMTERVTALVAGGKSKTEALHQTKREFNLSYEVVRGAYYKFREAANRIDVLRSDWRGYALGFPGGYPPHPSRIDPALEVLFGLRTFVERGGEEVELYIRIQKYLYDVKYVRDDSLRRWKQPTKRRRTVDSALAKFEGSYWRSRLELEKLCEDYRGWEKLINHDERDVYQELSG